MANIILTGMPGCGKSTLGVVLAKILNMGFCDTDILIQQNLGITLQELIDTKGVEEFLKTEERILCSLECENIVVATGGSAVLSEKAMAHLKSIGTVIFLDVPLSSLLRRLKNSRSRGIAFLPGQSYPDMYEYRLPLYRKYADITIDCHGSREAILNRIIDAVK